MASRDHRPEPRRPAARLYLAVPSSSDLAGLRSPLAAALGAADVAAVLLRLPSIDERSLINLTKTLAPVVQERGAALLLDGHADLVARAGADGVHLTGTGELREALSALKPDRIVGCGGLATRHDAMTAAEAGADYVLFGEPEDGGEQPSRDAVLERIGWWAEVFEVPCVGYAAALDEIGPLVAAGADFVAVGDFIFSDSRGAAAAIAEAAQRLAVAETVG